MIDTRINDMYILNENNLNNDKYLNELYLTLIINNHIEIMNNINHHIWKDNNHTIYYKTKSGENISETKEHISNFISKDIKEDILIVDDIYSIDKKSSNTGVHGYIYKYLLVNLIPYEIFNPFTDVKTYYDYSLNKHFSNTFRYSKYLKLRLSYKDNNIIDITQNSEFSNNFISKFIYHLVTNEKDYNTIIYWLSGFFQTLIKSNLALILVGDKNTSEGIFLNEIIKPIFGSNFCTTITANMIKEKSTRQIIKNKIFYHIGTLPNFTVTGKMTKQLLCDILTKNIDSTNINQDNTIFGQTLITSITLNQHLIENIKDNYKIIKINKFETIIKNLGCTKASFYRKLEKDLLEFSSFLLKIKLDNELFSSLNNNPYLNHTIESSYKIN